MTEDDLNQAIADVEALRVLVERVRNATDKDVLADLIVRAYWLVKGQPIPEVLDFKPKPKTPSHLSLVKPP